MEAVDKTEETAVGKKALVLAGGGVAGIAYELGALHALDRSLVGLTVNDFDIYVGTSAGATVTALLANGFSPGTILQAVQGEHEDARPFLRRDLWRFNLKHFLQAGISVPRRLWRMSQRYANDLRDSRLFGTLWVLLDLLPPSLYDSDGLEAYLRDLLSDLGGSNEFDKLNKELAIIATRLDSGQRVVFNRDSDVRISEAIAASSAVPGLYKPVRLNGADYVDGGVRGNASIDLAVEQGATTVICINPIVPHDGILYDGQGNGRENDGAEENDPALGSVSMQKVMSQVMRTRIHAGLHYHIKHLRHVYPHVDFYVIEPEKDDGLMTAPNLMRYNGRQKIARRAFESVTWQLARDHKKWAAIWQARGVRVRRGLDRSQLDQVAAAADEAAKLHELLQAYWPPETIDRRQKQQPAHHLKEALVQLENTITRAQQAAHNSPI